MSITSFYTQELLHTEAFTHYTQKILHTRAFTHSKHLHTETFTHRRFYTQTLLHTANIYTQDLLHTETFTHWRFYTQTLLHTASIYTQDLLHTGDFTHRHFYTQNLLHREAFTHRCHSHILPGQPSQPCQQPLPSASPATARGGMPKAVKFPEDWTRVFFFVRGSNWACPQVPNVATASATFHVSCVFFLSQPLNLRKK